MGQDRQDFVGHTNTITNANTNTVPNANTGSLLDHYQRKNREFFAHRWAPPYKQKVKIKIKVIGQMAMEGQDK